MFIMCSREETYVRRLMEIIRGISEGNFVVWITPSLVPGPSRLVFENMRRLETFVLLLISFYFIIIVFVLFTFGVIYVDIHGTLACFARRPGRPFTTRGLFSDNSGFACPGPEHWIEGMEPTAEDLEYFEELAEQ